MTTAVRGLARGFAGQGDGVDLLSRISEVAALPVRWLSALMDEADEAWDLADPFLTGDDGATSPSAW